MPRPSTALDKPRSALAFLALGVCLSLMAQSRRADAEERGETSAAATPSAADLEFFEKRVRPLLIARCHECHGAEKQKGSLRLDSQASIIHGGDTGPAVVPGKPDESLLVDAVRYGDTYQMPPKGRLPEEEVAVLVEWVGRGAPWPAESVPAAGATGGGAAFDFATRARHWCFQPLASAAPPAVKNAGWVRSPLDQFILAGLEARGLPPAPPAEKHVWLRRVTYDLTGLPPTPAEIAEFLADSTPQANEKVVERLLSSPHYGERQARRWLDLARFAETYGHEHDFEIPNAWPYRDYLIRAFNADLPYNRFLIEQVAGDLLNSPRRHPSDRSNESIVGTGFFFLGEARHSPVDVREDEAARIDNQIDVFAKTFLALTVGCARCHDHKFDCITQKDYYALAGYLQSSRYQQAFIDDPNDLAPTLQRLTALRSRERDAVTGYLRDVQLPRLSPQMAELVSGRAGNAAWKARWADVANRPDDVWHVAALLAASGTDESSFAARRAELAVRFAQSDTPQASPGLAHFDQRTFGDWIVTGPAFGNAPARPTDLEPVSPADGAASPVRLLGVPAAHSGLSADQLAGVLRSPTFTIEQPRIFYRVWGTGGQVRLIVDGLQLIQDPIYGGLKFGPGGTKPHWHEQNVEKWIGHRAYVELVDDGPGWLALEQVVPSDQPPRPAGPPSPVAKLLNDPAVQTAQDIPAAYQRLFSDALSWWSSVGEGAASDPQAAGWCSILNELLGSAAYTTPAADAADNLADHDKRAREQWQAISAERAQIVAAAPAPRRALAMADGTPEDECVFIRGNHKTPGERVPRRGLQVLGGEQHLAPADRSGRLELAQSLVDGSQPLVPRVIANRVWQWHFGRGIVATPDDFGAMGQLPTHPELLDWLAAELMRDGWSLKSLQRKIVLSSTYNMASTVAPEAFAADPENRSWHHVPRHRLEAECIRDAVLAVSGRLDRTMFGPGVAPHLSPFMSGRGRPKESGPLDGAGRRSIYLNVRRNFLSPLLLAFDYPTPFTAIGRRSTSNVPAQALVMLNNPFVAEQADHWAQRIIADPARSDSDRITTMYLEAFGRPADAEELAAVATFLAEQRKTYGNGEELPAWSDLGHVLFNAKEFVFVE